MTADAARYMRWFADICIDDIPLVGGKNASLGEMVQALSSQGVQVPDGFAILLVEHGIDSMSLNLDAVMKTTLRILEPESGTGRTEGTV